MEIHDNISRYRRARPGPAIDPADVCCEFYNSGTEDVTFESFHPDRDRHWFLDKPPIVWMRFVCKVGEWIFLPHQKYVGTVPSGSQEIKGILNFGDEMGKGNRLPSRPEAKQVRFFQK